jgi:hypothetical protein
MTAVHKFCGALCGQVHLSVFNRAWTLGRITLPVLYAVEYSLHFRNDSHRFDGCDNTQESVTYPTVILARFIFCDDTDLVTNLVTKQIRPTEVSPY